MGLQMTEVDEQINTFLKHVANDRHSGQTFDAAVRRATLRRASDLDSDVLENCIKEAHRILANKPVCYCTKCGLQDVLFTSRQQFGTSAWYCFQCQETFYRY